MFFYPKDFPFVCPTEIKGFGDINSQFADRDCRVPAASTDSEFAHLAWRKDHKDLRDLPFPMPADIKTDLTSALGILGGDGSVGCNPQKVLRVLDALQTNELCPSSWSKR